MSPLRSPIPLLDEPAPAPCVQNASEKENGSGTPVPVSASPVPAPATPVPEPLAEAKPPETLVTVQITEGARSPKLSPANVDSMSEGGSVAAIEETNDLARVPTPEVLITESSPVVERSSQPAIEPPQDQRVVSPVPEQAQESSAGS